MRRCFPLLLRALAAGIAVKHRRERERAQQELLATQTQLVEALERELQIAHDMQMGLLPQSTPAVPGFDLAGRCLPANHVGGDCGPSAGVLSVGHRWSGDRDRAVRTSVRQASRRGV